MSDDATISFSAESVPGLLAAALELLGEVEMADEALMPDSVLEAAADFHALVDEHIDVVDGPRAIAPFDWDGPS